MPPRQEHHQRTRIRTLHGAGTVTRRTSASERKFRKEGSLTGHEAHGHAKALKHDTVYYVPLGGLEEVGRNCSFFEYNDEIVIIDMGIQFPEEETPGVDWIITNTSYLEKKKEKYQRTFDNPRAL